MDWYNVKLNDSSCESADFSRANLRGAFFACTDLNDAKFEATDLSGTQLDYIDFHKLFVDLNDVKHSEIVLHLAIVRCTTCMDSDELEAWAGRGALLDNTKYLGEGNSSNAIYPYVYGSVEKGEFGDDDW